MSSATVAANCPHCGSLIKTTATASGIDDQRLKGTATDCNDCRNSVELYYY